MYNDKIICVVVPAYNEEKLIGHTLESIPEFVDWVVVVDDCSQDKTSDIIQEWVSQQPERFVLLNHIVNQGVGGAIASGYKWCRDHSIDVAVVMDGDSQMAPEDLPSLLDPVVMGEVDYAKGNRLISGEAWAKIPKVRYLGNAVLSFLTKIASGYWHIADSQSGYTAINAKALKAIDWDLMYKRYGHPNDRLVRLNIYNFRVRDVEIHPVYGIGEVSGFNPILIIPSMAWLILKLFIKRMVQKYVIRDFHPLIFFYLMSFGLLALSVPLFVRIMYFLFMTGYIPPMNTLIFVFCAILGAQSLFFAMWFDMLDNQHLR
jgi:glycosyltransferase involved in cell wall biosynthesis